MKKSQVNCFEQGSAAHVVAHARRQVNRGRQASMAYTSVSGRHFPDPKQALVVAEYEAMILALEDTPEKNEQSAVAA